MMTRPIEAAHDRTRRLRWMSVLVTLALSGCVTAGGGFGIVAAPKPTAPPVDPRLAADPEAFAIDDIALWNGEVTQAGAWIAHPDAEVARRVRLTNTENGAQVDAAMLLRDPAVPGPRVVVSAATAGALGLEPGHATPVTIVALRYLTVDEIAAAKAAEQAPEAAPAESAEAPEEPATDADLSAIAAAETRPDPATEVNSRGAAVADDPEEATAPATADTPPAGAGAPDAVADEADARELAAEIETALASLFAEEAGADRLTDPAYAPGPDTPVPQPRPQSARPAAGADQGAIADGQAFVHAGTYAGADATAVAKRLREAGLTVEIRTLTRGTERLSRVLVGPFASVTDRDAALAAVRNAGVADAAPSGG